MLDIESKSLAALVSLDGVGQRTAAALQNELYTQKISWEEFWSDIGDIGQKLSISEKIINACKNFIKEHTIDSNLDALEKKHIRVITQENREYPPLLKTIENSPVVIFARGEKIDWESRLRVAVVGTRHMTAYGKLVTEKITRELVAQDVIIVSGAMYGVDLCAHTTAVHQGGKTIGVLGYGFDFVYPRSQASVLQSLENQGMTFFTPFAPNVRPAKGNFPARNALVAGMCDAVVVTEAAEKSGTHITAGYAVDFGRTVCAVPGPITSPYSAGTTWLVNQGAVMVSSGEDVVREVGGVFDKQSTSVGSLELNSKCLTKRQQLILDVLTSLGGASLDQINQQLPLSAQELFEGLLQIEVLGLITKVGSMWIRN